MKLLLFTKSVDIMRFVFTFVLFSIFIVKVTGQSANDILNVLVDQKTITQYKADSLRADFSIKQQEKLPDKRLRIDAEIRPRTEYRNGYQLLRNDTTTAAFFTNQRFRVGLNYSFNNRFIVQFTIQDLRVWGQQDPRTTSATLQVFEGWVEPLFTNKFSVRIGRQRLMYDNQRLFAENDWRLTGAVHDAVNFRYYGPKLNSELALAFNQSSERYFGTDYNTIGFTNYKFLAVNYIRYKPGKTFTYTALNSADGYQKVGDPKKMNLRYNIGGRIEAESAGLYGTLSAYYQFGTSPYGKDLSAWYIQPEIRYTSSKGLVIRLGTEVFSGNDNSIEMITDHSFVPLYGVAHRFNGSMDLITRFPGDVGGAGLINPYLFVIKSLSAKFDIRADFHTFHLQKDYYLNDENIDRYLGFENDFLLTFKPNAVTKVDLGLSYMLPTDSFAVVKKFGSGDYNLTWVYLSLTFKPQLLGLNFK
jgi:hypothetical protein